MYAANHGDGARGFSLLEMVISTGLMLVVMATVFTMMHPAQGAFAAEPEVADMQQRLRVGADTLSKELIMAGAGAYQGLHAGSLGHYFPSVLPFRQGATNDDPPGTFATDRITIIYVPSTTAQTTLSADLSGATTTFTPAVESDCPLDPSTGQAAKLCGFAKGQTVLVYDDTGSYSLFTITAVADSTATLTAKKPAGANTPTFAAGSKIVEASNHTYYLKTDVSKKTYQLMHYGGTSNSDVPVVDNVVGLEFDYYGDAQPPIVREPVLDVPATTYGPKPSAVPVAPWGAFENCLFSPGAIPAPKLAVLGAGGPALVPLTATELTDGPFCPNDTNANRWDADLLRIRKIGVTLRVQTPVAALRGPAGVLFARGGTSAGGVKWVPDQELHFDISPRNLNLGR
jgi:Tfp pilus assembly protein PilW